MKKQEENIKVRIESEAPNGIEKLEIYVNGSKRETINDRKHEGTLSLPKGKYEIYVKAYSKDCKKKETGKINIGTGGVKWDEPDPTPTPSPTPTPTPSPTTSVSPSPSPTSTP